MDTATAVLLAKGAIVIAGLVVFLRHLVKEYDRVAKSMAGAIARAALDRERRESAPPRQERPRVTVSPANGVSENGV